MDKPLISIILPVFNSENFLQDCLDSILKQSFINWELILVDDYSTDKSMEIIQAYEKKDSRLKYIKNTKEKGIIPALEEGYKVSRGTYISRMDSDDIMPENKLVILFKNLTTKGEGYVSTGMVKYFSSNKELEEGYRNYESWLNGLITEQDIWSEVYKECPIASPNWLISRTDLEKSGGISIGIYPEDYDLVFRMYKTRLKIVKSSEITHLWRDHPQRVSRNSLVYKDNNFLQLKCKYFLEIERFKYKHIYVWGAGRKGKVIAKNLNDFKLNFTWITNNKKKVGHYISDILIQDFLDQIYIPESAVIISTTQDRSQILEFCKSKKLTPYLFC